MALLRIAASAYVAVLSCLMVFLGAGSLLGWDPVVVRTDGGIDHLSRGDVVLVAESSIEPGRSAVAAVELQGRTVIRRLHSLGPAGIVATIDGQPISVRRVAASDDPILLAQVVVPAFGLPLVWLDGGPQLLLFFGWLALTIGALGLTVGYQGRPLVRRNLPRPEIGSGTQSGRWPLQAQVDLLARRLRLTLAATVIAAYVLDPGSIGVGDRGLPRWWLVAAGTAVLAPTILVVRSERHQDRFRWLALAGSTVAAAIGASTASSGLTWLILVIPVAEAALVFGPAAAAATWLALGGLVLTGRSVLLTEGAHSSAPIEFDHVVGQLGLVLLAVIPAAYLVDRLIAEVGSRQRIADDAEERGRLIKSVAAAGRDLSAADSLPMIAAIDRAIDLGFDSADIVESSNGVDWVESAAVGDRRLPAAGAHASGVRYGDRDATLVTAEDLDAEQRRALTDHGLRLVTAATISKRLGRTIVLRAAIAEGRSFSSDQVELFRLLAGNVALAARNDDLTAEVQLLRERHQLSARLDRVTGLANHDGLVQDLTLELLDSETRPVVVVWALRGFEALENRLGHERGEALLGVAGNRIRRVAGAHCSAARIGAGEFALLVPGAPSEEVIADTVHRMERVGRDPFQVDGELVHVTATVGVAVGRAGTASSELIRRAQVARQVGEQSGDPNDRSYRPDFDRDRERRSSLALALGSALADAELGEGGLRVEYQPVHRLDGAHPIVGFQACLRWEHDLYGEVRPEEAREVAQTAGRIGDLSRLVADQVCLDIAAVISRFPDLAFFVSLRLSPGELASPELLATVRRAMAVSAFDPSHLVLELGEYVMSEVDDVDGVNLDALTALGIGLFVDGSFGGLSRSELNRLPLTGLRLDRQLVERAAVGRSDRMVAESVVAMGRRLGLQVVAEGIESEPQLETVIKFGCLFGQGSFLGQSVEANRIADLVAGEGESSAQHAVGSPIGREA